MKTIEEKAKAYDEALKYAMIYYKDGNEDMKMMMKTCFPVLVEESEDEKIRKELISFFTERAKHTEDSTFNGLSSKEIIAWLEKQGEHKKFRDSIQVGDKVTRNEDGVLVNLSQLKRVAKPAEVQDEQKPVEPQQDMLSQEKYAKAVDECIYGEQKPADEVEPKFKVGDWVVLSTLDGEKVVQIDSIEYFKSGEPRYITSEGRWFGNGTKARLLTDKDVEITTIPESKVIVNQKPAWSEEDEKFVHGLIRGLAAKRDIHGHTTFSSDCIDITETIDWLKSLKDRVQQKQEWSEEDEKEVAVLEAYIRSKDWSERHIDRALGIVDELVNKVKSLRPQSQWKPSDEQIQQLGWIAKQNKDNMIGKELMSLYQDLKKLK